MLAQSQGTQPVEWRISVAEIERDGPFSDYSGYDRTIVAEDAGFTLEFEDGERAEIAPLVPFAFAGERPVFCRLHGSPATAFNVMTLRGAYRHEIRVEDAGIEVSLIDVLSEGPTLERECPSFEGWEAQRRSFASWEALVRLRFAQNVRDQRAKAASEALSRIAPIVQRQDAQAKQRLLNGDKRSLESRLGGHVFTRWQQDVFAFNSAIEEQLAEESRLYDEYTRLVAGAVYRFLGKEHSGASLGAFARNCDRELRREANALQWGFYQAHGDEIDRTFTDLVRCRTDMARRSGYHSYADLAYVRLGRTDYGRRDVAGLRDRICEHVTPLCSRIVERQARDLAVEAVMPWDELVFDRADTLRTGFNDTQLLEAVTSAFRGAHAALGDFASLMRDASMFDLPARLGKRGGAFCSFFFSTGLPFVFANCTGTSGDVMSVVHELGHAFQDYSSRRQPVLEYIVPTAETAEIYSLGLEYLLWPHYEAFFGADASRYRAQHLKSMILMLPYIAAVDHFQELVYDNPGLSAAERRRAWLELHARYLPYRRIDAVPHLAVGGGWQRQHHIFGFPFYYIDYALALFAAFDLWRRSYDAYQETVQAYVEMASFGGSLPFRQLLRTFRIADPFDPPAIAGTLAFLSRSPELLSAAP